MVPRRWNVAYLSVSLLAVCTMAVMGAAPTEGPSVRRRGPNPALIYWQGVALLPDLTKVERQLPTDVSGGRVAADHAQVAALLEKVRPALQRFKRASGSTVSCDWGITLDEGPYAVMPQVAKMQFMCRLGVMQAEHLFATKQPAQALEWLLAVHRAARHLGEGDMLAPLLEEYSLEAHALRATARHLQGLDANLRYGHRQQLDLIPPLHQVDSALRGEQTVAEWLHRMVLGIESSPDAESALEAMMKAAQAEQNKAGPPSPGAGAGAGAGAAQQGVEPSSMDLLQSWQTQHEVIRTVFRQMQEACKLPWREANAELQRIQADPQLAIPAAQNLFVLVENHLRKRQETETQQRMLKAALMLGPELRPGLLSNWNDAFFEEPLVVREENDRLIITMRQLVGSREVVLRMGPVVQAKP